MELNGLHHITMITGDAQRNVDFYADLLGLRLVKKTVNFDQPEAYHLYFGDEQGSPGSILTWFEFAGRLRARPASATSTPSSSVWARRPRSPSGPSGSRPAATRARASTARCASPTSTGCSSSSS